MPASNRLLRAAMGASIGVAAILGAAHAQQSQPSTGPTSTGQPPAPNADQLLQKYPNAGNELTNAVEAMVLADPSTFKSVLALATNATDAQKSAIATGLAQATKVEVLTNQPLATDWQQQLAAITDSTFKVAATDAFGDVQLGSVGGSSVGAPGSGLGGPGSAPGGPTGGGAPGNPQTNPVSTQSFSLTSSVGGANALSNSVSP
jgi:hypothetical protein